MAMVQREDNNNSRNTSNNPYAKNRYILVNDEYLMANGIFKDNPFHKQYKVTRIVGYLMGNPEKSKARIKRLMRKTGYSRYTEQVVDDVYGYAMDFHSSNSEKDFRPNYHNSTDYIIEQYLDIALKQAIQSYNSRKLLNKKTRETNIVDDSGSDDEGYVQGTITSRHFEAEELETSRTESGYFYECFDYLMVLVENTKPAKKRLTPEMVYDIFLGGFDRVQVRRQITRREGYYELGEDYYEDIHKKYKMTQRQVDAWMKRIKKSEDYEPFKEMTTELVLPISEGNFFREDIIGFELDE